MQRWIVGSRVLIDGRVASSSDRVRAGMRIEVRPGPPATTQALPDAGVNFRELYIDEHLVVIDKPPGLVVHPSRGHETGTLVNGLLARGYMESWTESDDEDLVFARPGVVHRLDKGTSGVMVVARTGEARERLKALFAEHRIVREYVAIATGRVASCTFSTLHGRHLVDRLRFSSRVRSGKSAITHVDALEPIGAVATFVRCRLETGRTHQIRVHLADSGHAVFGDPLYGKTPKKAGLREIWQTLGRQALHAARLGFEHPITGSYMEWITEPSADFLQTLRALRYFEEGSDSAS